MKVINASFNDVKFQDNIITIIFSVNKIFAIKIKLVEK